LSNTENNFRAVQALHPNRESHASFCVKNQVERSDRFFEAENLMAGPAF
jgi:hypothetical protein